jgi:HSP20 family protein
MATQQKTQEDTGKGQQETRNDQSDTGQSMQSRKGNREQGSRAIQRQQVPAPFSPFMLGPFALIRSLQEDIDRVFGVAARSQGAMTRPGQGSATDGAQGGWSPALETFQRGNEFVVRVALPGLSADDVVIEVGEDALTIRGERGYEHEEEREGTTVTEFAYGAFVRVVPLPPGAIADDARAELRNGVLEIAIPAPSQEARRGRRLEIQQGSNQGGESAKDQQNRS